MKISSYMNNMNPIIEKNDVKVQKENKQANEKHTMEQSVKDWKKIVRLVWHTCPSVRNA